MILISAALDWRINVSPFNQGPGEIRGLFFCCIIQTRRITRLWLRMYEPAENRPGERDSRARLMGLSSRRWLFFYEQATTTAHRAK